MKNRRSTNERTLICKTYSNRDANKYNHEKFHLHFSITRRSHFWYVSKTVTGHSDERSRFIGIMCINKGTCVCDVFQNIRWKHPAKNKRYRYRSKIVKLMRMQLF